jgi:ribulose-5-phosphate 4-epimerase/fuculose-1-phosphate aldolase
MKTNPEVEIPESWTARLDLAAAHRLAVKDGFTEGIDNHFTLTVPGRPDRFLLNAFGLHWSEVTASNLIEVTLDGAVVSGEGEANLSAVSIHAPIHRRGIACVLHGHMPYTTALSQLEDMELEPSSQNGAILCNLMGYDNNYNGFATSQEEGKRMADVLGNKKILLLANHGAIATGDSVAQAYHRLYFLERAAMTQMIAAAAGKRRMISDNVMKAIPSSPSGTRNAIDPEVVMYFEAMKRVLAKEGSDYAA